MSQSKRDWPYLSNVLARFITELILCQVAVILGYTSIVAFGMWQKNTVRWIDNGLIGSVLYLALLSWRKLGAVALVLWLVLLGTYFGAMITMFRANLLEIWPVPTYLVTALIIAMVLLKDYQAKGLFADEKV